jgi:hypothetical protein
MLNPATLPVEQSTSGRSTGRPSGEGEQKSYRFGHSSNDDAAVEGGATSLIFRYRTSPWPRARRAVLISGDKLPPAWEFELTVHEKTFSFAAKLSILRRLVGTRVANQFP